MKATRFEFRYRIAIIFLLYFFGFLAPWERYSGHSKAVSTAWLELSGTLAGAHWLTLQDASLLVTSLAVLLAFAGAALRVWAAAWLGTDVVYSTSMSVGRAGEVVAGGPYRYLRNPLYVGLFLYSAAVAILMPPTGAIFFLVAMLVFELRLIGGEEAHLAARLGESYFAYRKLVPRLVPAPVPRVAAPPASPRWLHGALAEICPIGVAFSFAVFAWRYNAQLLTQAVIVCFGISLVVQALLPGRQTTKEKQATGRLPSA